MSCHMANYVSGTTPDVNHLMALNMGVFEIYRYELIVFGFVFPFKVIYYWCNKIKQIKNVIFSYGIIFEQKIFLLKERPREKFDVN